MVNSRSVSVLVLVFVCSVFGKNLVPDTPGNSGDYFCTWNVQGYVCSHETNEDQREAMNEDNIFGDGEYQGWVNFYEKLRGDLLFVMDDSYDVPKNGDREYFGSMIVNEERFPSYTGEPAERLKKLVENVKAKGWKGLGLWVSSQESPRFINGSPREYWIERFKWTKDAGVDYWKVDWGANGKSYDWRRMLSELGDKELPGLVIEHAMMSSVMEFAKVFRTDDVDSVIAIPQTLDRVGQMLEFKSIGDTRCIINCEDEPYIGAALGCAIGIKRHPFKGKLPDGEQDSCYPPVGRDLKNRADEVVRAVRWHRIAPPFGVGVTKDVVDSKKLADTWYLEANETLNSPDSGGTLRQEAPARISRGLELAEVSVWGYNTVPYVLASKHPNGAVAVATQGRTKEREFILERARVRLKVGRDVGPIGIFGRYETLTLDFSDLLDGVTIWGQDLAGSSAVDITGRVKIEGSRLIVPGDLIDEIGLADATINDKSDPGMVIVIEK